MTRSLARPPRGWQARRGEGAGLARSIPNGEIADVLERVADLLDAQEANPFRVRAYRNAAETVRRHDAPLWRLHQEGGAEALDELPGIGKGLATQIGLLLEHGRLPMLDRLEGDAPAEALLRTVPGIGPRLAERLHHELGVESLEDLEQAAHDGRLADVPGFGARRVRAMREELASMLRRAARRRARARRPHAASGDAPERPSVETLLAVDAEYRERAARGELRRIAPRRFNPRREAWLPIWHTDRDGWHLTALFSNTARAHELGRTDDWVVIFWERDGDEGQCTVVTETRGERAGRRVVRGREEEGSA